jgi:hypothetical protein
MTVCWLTKKKWIWLEIPKQHQSPQSSSTVIQNLSILGSIQISFIGPGWAPAVPPAVPPAMPPAVPPAVPTVVGLGEALPISSSNVILRDFE